MIPRPLRCRTGAVAFAALAFAGPLAAQRPTLSPPLARALARDTAYTVWLFARPRVSLSEVAARARAAGAVVRVGSRWLHAVGVLAPTPALRILATDPGLRHIQPAGRGRGRPGPTPLAPSGAQALDTCAAGGDPVYGPSEMPYRQLDLRPLADLGLDGTGVRVVILDAGFNTLQPAFAGVKVGAQWDFVFGDSVVRDQANDQPGAESHGTAVWSLFAGSVPGRLVGIARGATYLLAKTEDIRSETRVEEFNYVAALEWADSIGVDVASSSLGYLAFDNGFVYTPGELNGDVAVTTVAADSAAARGILVVTAAGNEGPGYRTIVTPGDGDSVLTVGAEDSLGAITGFSSRGPTADGRLKPDLTAPGLDVCAVTGAGLGRVAGTSFATPITAAAAVLLKQLQPGLGPTAIITALRMHATHRAAPDSTYGWGRPDVAASATFPAGLTPVHPVPPALASVSPPFEWTAGAVPPFALPVSYRLRVARDSLLGGPMLDTAVVNVTAVDPAIAVKPGLPLYWRVDAVAANGVAATTGPVGPMTTLPWATLTSLSDPAGATTGDTQPTFTWHPSPVAAPPGPFRYDLFVYRTAESVPLYGIGNLPDTSYQLPQPLERNATYRWDLVVHAGPDTSLVPSEGAFLVTDASAPPATLLYQNFPNPFPGSGRDVTCIWFDLAQTIKTSLTILDLRGGVVRHLVPGLGVPDVLPAGRYGRGAPGGALCDPRFAWDGRADDGRRVAPGVYLYKLSAGSVLEMKRIVFLGEAP